MSEYRGFIFKKGLVWIGWVLRLNKWECDYVSCDPEFEPRPDEICYMTIGLSEKSVIKRLQKHSLMITGGKK